MMKSQVRATIKCSENGIGDGDMPKDHALDDNTLKVMYILGECKSIASGLVRSTNGS